MNDSTNVTMSVDDYKKLEIGEICYFNLSVKTIHDVMDNHPIMGWKKGDKLKVLSFEQMGENENDFYLPVFWNFNTKSSSTLLREYGNELSYLKEDENSKEYKIQKEMAEKYASHFPLNVRNWHEQKIMALLEEYTQKVKGE